MEFYLAIDIGASSGRHILFSVEDNKLLMEEVYRFENKMIKENGHLHWDIDKMFKEVLEGIKICKTLYKIPKSIGIDTWAVDYVLLDENGDKLSNPYAYRDNRTLDVIDEVHKYLPQDYLYQKTGIQYQPFNTIYQLASEIEESKEKAKHFLMIPDYLNYMLTGVMLNEYTNMSTTQLLDATSFEINDNLLSVIGIDKNIFKDIVNPGTLVGSLRKEIVQEIGFDTEVVAVTTHDSACAFFGAIRKDGLLLSSGTWSLLGILSDTAIISDESKLANFTNEGGYNHQFRFLKNIMGLWIIQEVVRIYEGKYSFADLVELANQCEFDEVFDVNDSRFLNPDNMVEEIQNYFKERDWMVPETAGEIAKCIYNSLAISYREAIDELEKITNKTYDTINVVGGGCKNELLNEMLAKVTNKIVIAGPSEATAIGNALCQCLYYKKIKDVEEAQKIITNSFEIKYYKGESTND